jgi:N-acetylmuramoyl-L-alanine amidase
MRLIVLILFIFGLFNFTILPFILVIDPGHGGNHLGAQGINKLVLEKDATLDIALRLCPILDRHGIEWRLTRAIDKAFDTDLRSDLIKRIEYANEFKADAFISIHFNSSSSLNIRKFEVYIPYSPSFDLKSYVFAAHLHDSLVRAVEPSWGGVLGNLNQVDGGIRQGRFNVLMFNNCPISSLIELDYLSNIAGERDVANPIYCQKLAEALANGIIAYVSSGSNMKPKC